MARFGMHTCTSTWIAVGGIYNNGSIDRGSAKKVCFVYDISSWPAEDVSAQGGGGGAGDLFEYGCPEVPEALQISGLSSATLSSVTVPLYTVAQDCAYDCWTFSRNVTLAARFQATGEVNRSSYFSWHEWIDGCMRTDNGIDEWRQASVDLTVDGKQMPIHGLLGSYIAHGQFTYSQACM